MIKYHGDRLWVKLALGTASIIWGLIVAFVCVKVTVNMSGWVQTFARITLFLMGFTALDLSVKREAGEEDP